MRILAIDTATERCSVAAWDDGHCVDRAVDTARGHAELILPMVDEVLDAVRLGLGEFDALAFGRGPGAFTGVRIAAGVIQGLAYGCGLPVVGISDLEALAFAGTAVGERALVAIDARMGEVYWAVYEKVASDAMRIVCPERVGSPTDIRAPEAVVACLGSGLRAHPAIATRFADARCDPDALPHARSIAALGATAARLGLAGDASQALPVYLRDDVVRTRPP